MLLEPRSSDRGYFQPEALKRIFAEHRNKFRDHGNKIWRLMNLEVWQRVMVDGEPAESVAAQLNSQAPVRV